jgi:hypothetical protein
MFDVLKPISPLGHSCASWSIYDVYAQILNCPSAEDSIEYLLIESFSPIVLVSGPLNLIVLALCFISVFLMKNKRKKGSSLCAYTFLF